jgi:hypothetical protein
MSRNRLKLFLSLTGLALTAVALKLRDDRVTWAAIAFLAAAVLVRFVKWPTNPSSSGSETDPPG